MARGTIYQRRGTWTIGFTVNGRRVREAVGPNKKLAELILQKRIAEAIEGKYFSRKSDGRTPFAQFASMYQERVVSLLKSKRTERTRVDRWARLFGSRTLASITRAEIEAWRREKLGSARPATVNRDLCRLRHMFNRAVEWKLLGVSPMLGLKFLRENNARQRYLTTDEAAHLISCCVAPHIRAVVTLALHTGMRLGEMLALRVADVSFLSNTILIRDSKNGNARHVPMDTTVTELMKTCSVGKASDEAIFCNYWGNQLSDVRWGFLKALERSGIVDLHFHDLRHTFASHFMMAGGDLYVLKELLGHKSITMTQRYAHLSTTYKSKMLGVMERVWNPEPREGESAANTSDEPQPKATSGPIDAGAAQRDKHEATPETAPRALGPESDASADTPFELMVPSGRLQ